MHNNLSFNDKIVGVSDAELHALSAAGLYGRGIFTTIPIVAGTPFLWEKHWARIVSDAAQLGLDMSAYPEEKVTEALKDLIERNGVVTGRARVTFFDERSGSHWPFDSKRNTGILIATGDKREMPGSFRITVSPYTINSASPLAGVKSCNYLENLLALEDAHRHGFGEAIRLNERGQLTAACMANIFWEKDGRLFTPALTSGCLRGTIRDFVIEKYGAEETSVRLDAIENADAVFLTSSGIGIMPVAAIDGRKFETNRLSLKL